jgi:hypothetical protein
MFRSNLSSGGSVSSVRSTPASSSSSGARHRPVPQLTNSSTTTSSTRTGRESNTNRRRTASQDGLQTADGKSSPQSQVSPSYLQQQQQLLTRGTPPPSTSLTPPHPPKIQEETEDGQSISSEQSRQPRSSRGSQRVIHAHKISDNNNYSYTHHHYPPITKSYSSSTGSAPQKPNVNQAQAQAIPNHHPFLPTNTHTHTPPLMIRHSSLSPPRSYPQVHRRATSTQQHTLMPTSSATSSHTIMERNAVQAVIDDLNKAIGHDRRMAALSNACQEFDHWDTHRHDLEISLGAVNVLSLVLSMTSETDEVQMRMICAALEMIYRASPAMIQQSYKEVGKPLLPVLLRFLSTCEAHSAAHYNNSSSNNNNNNNNRILITDVTLLNITKVLLYFSRVPSLRTTLVQQHQGLLHALARVATTTHTTTSTTINSTSFSPTSSNNTITSYDTQPQRIQLQNQHWVIPLESRIARIRVIANLANEEENRAAIYQHVIDAIITLAIWDTNESVKEYAAAALMDLAAADRKITIEMVNNHTNILHALIHLLGLCNTTTTPNTTNSTYHNNMDVREYALTAIQNLAFPKENRIPLITFQGGILLEALKQILLLGESSSSCIHTTATPSDDAAPSSCGTNYYKAQRRAAGAITNLTCKETVELLANHEGLLETLVKISCCKTSGISKSIKAERNNTRKCISEMEEDNEVQATQKRSSIALIKMANCMTSTMSCHNRLLQSLIQTIHHSTSSYPSSSSLSSSSSIEDYSTIANILRTKARIAENRLSMARFPNLLDILSQIAITTSASMPSSSRRRVMNSSSGILQSQEDAIRALMHLTNEPANLIIMGAHEKVLDALVYGASLTPSAFLSLKEEERQQQQRHWDVIRLSSLTAIERLATDVTNRRAMARRNGILVALAMAVEREAMDEQATTSNSSVSDQKSFARALLMSLLLAM